MKFIKVANLIVLIFTLVYLLIIQVFDPFDLAKVWRSRHIPHKKILVAKRGDFLDRSGRTLVSSDDFYQIDIDKNLLSIHSRKTGDSLSSIYSSVASILDSNLKMRTHPLLTKSSGFESVYIKNMVPATDVKRIIDEFEKSNLPLPLISYNGSKRNYLSQLDLEPIIGEAKSISKKVTDSRVIRENLVGLSGLEKFFETNLQGEDGWRKFYVNGTPYIRENYENEAKDGANIVLTIDGEIQKILTSTLRSGIKKYKAKSAMGIVMNPNTGEILASCGYDNKKGNVILPFRNYSISYLFEPGSTIKPFILQLALDNELFDLDSKIDCSPYKVKGEDRTIKDHASNSRKSDTLNLEQILQYSSNVGVMKIVEKIGGESLYNRLKNLGFGSYLLTDMYGEEPGILRDPSQWSGYTLTSLSIGHEIALTPVQLASAYASIANGGYLLRPYIVKRIELPNGKSIVKSKKILSKISNSKNVNTIKDMMSKVVEGGTAVQTNIKNMHIAGKTGTAEELGRSKKGDLVHSSSFCGFFPIENPKYLILIVYEGAKGKYRYAAQSAVPTFRQIVTKMMVDPDIDVVGKEKIIEMPNFVGLNKAKVNFILKEKGIFGKILQKKANDTIVIDQFPKPHLKFATGIPITIIMGSEEKVEAKESLDFVGLTMREAFSLAKEKNINIEVTGSGVIKAQDDFGFIFDLRAE